MSPPGLPIDGPEIEPLDERQMRNVCDQQLALGVRDVAGELVAAVIRVPPDHDVAPEGGSSEPEAELGHVVEQDADVRGARAQQLRGEPGADPRFGRPRPPTTMKGRPPPGPGARRRPSLGASQRWFP